MTHETKVMHDNEARCSCGWRLACIDAVTAAKECWRHVQAARPLVTQD